MIVVVLTIGLYAAIRVVSLHQIDGVLHNRHLAGVRYGTIIEFALLFGAGGCALWTPSRRLATDPASAEVAA